MEDKYSVKKEDLILDILLTLHQEKRTALVMIRIGIATFIAQIAILGFLIATSKFYQWVEVMHLVIPFILLNLIVFGIASYLIFRSILKINQLDRRILRYYEFHGIDVHNHA
jgi:hypothetical protein